MQTQPDRPQRLIIQGWCSFAVPEDWTWNEEEGITSIYSEAVSAGAITITLYFRPEAHAPRRQELIELAMKLAHGFGRHIEPTDVQVIPFGAGEASYVELIDDLRDEWRVWHIADPQRVICITYNCALDTGEPERETVDRIISSFQWLAVDEHTRKGTEPQ